MKKEDFVKTLPEGRAKRMWEKLVDMERVSGGKIDYSLEG